MNDKELIEGVIDSNFADQRVEEHITLNCLETNNNTLG